jgi:hypothetical protein
MPPRYCQWTLLKIKKKIKKMRRFNYGDDIKKKLFICYSNILIGIVSDLLLYIIDRIYKYP